MLTNQIVGGYGCVNGCTPPSNLGQTDLFGLQDFDIPVVPIVIGFGVIFIGVVLIQSYLAMKAGAGIERVAERWIDKKYK